MLAIKLLPSRIDCCLTFSAHCCPVIHTQNDNESGLAGTAVRWAGCWERTPTPPLSHPRPWGARRAEYLSERTGRAGALYCAPLKSSVRLFAPDSLGSCGFSFWYLDFPGKGVLGEFLPKWVCMLHLSLRTWTLGAEGFVRFLCCILSYMLGNMYHLILLGVRQIIQHK